MKSITSFESFKNTVNEETAVNLQGYTKDDVETAFRGIEDDLSDYYSIDSNNTSISLEWDVKYGSSLEVECTVNNIEFDFDHSSFSRALIRSISQDPDSTGPRFTKAEIERAISEAHHDAVFQENIEMNSSDFATRILVEQNRFSTELTVTGEIEEDSADLSEADIDTDVILEKIIDELYGGVARRIDYA
jgi:hypothetical protein